MANTKLKKVTLSYPVIFKAKAFGNDGKAEPKFGATFILDKKDPQAAMLQKEVESIRVEHKLPKNVKTCLHDGAEVEKEGYGPGVVFIRCSSSADRPPYAVDRNPAKRLTAEDDKIYGGAIVNGELNFWVQNNSFGQRINANIIGVQYVDEGTRFGDSPVDPTESCENLEEAESVL